MPALTALVSTVPRGRCEYPESPAAAPALVSQTGTVRVLVVEDERRLASAVRRGLTAEGFVVDVAHDGVILALPGQVQAVHAVISDVDDEPLGDQAAAHRGGEPPSVFYH